MHEIVIPGRGDVHRSNNFCLRQLPNVELVQVEDTLNLEDRFANFAEGNVGRDTLEKNI